MTLMDDIRELVDSDIWQDWIEYNHYMGNEKPYEIAKSLRKCNVNIWLDSEPEDIREKWK